MDMLTDNIGEKKEMVPQMSNARRQNNVHSKSVFANNCKASLDQCFWKRVFYAHALCIYLIELKTKKLWKIITILK